MGGLCVRWSWFFFGEGHGVRHESLALAMYSARTARHLELELSQGRTDDCCIIFWGGFRSYGRQDHSVNTGHRINTTQCAIFPRSSVMCLCTEASVSRPKRLYSAFQPPGVVGSAGE